MPGRRHQYSSCCEYGIIGSHHCRRLLAGHSLVGWRCFYAHQHGARHAEPRCLTQRSTGPPAPLSQSTPHTCMHGTPLLVPRHPGHPHLPSSSARASLVHSAHEHSGASFLSLPHGCCEATPLEPNIVEETEKEAWRLVPLPPSRKL